MFNPHKKLFKELYNKAEKSKIEIFVSVVDFEFLWYRWGGGGGGQKSVYIRWPL